MQIRSNFETMAGNECLIAERIRGVSLRFMPLFFYGFMKAAFITFGVVPVSIEETIGYIGVGSV